MNCDYCNACQSDAGYEHDATEYWCELGQDNESGPDEEELGCNLTEEEIEKALPEAREADEKAFVKQCDDYMKYVNDVNDPYLFYASEYNHEKNQMKKEA